MCRTNASEVNALHAAVWRNHVPIVERILEAGGSTEQQDGESGWTPLHRAFYFGHLAVASRLLSAGASTEASDFRGRTPLDLLSAHATGLQPPGQQYALTDTGKRTAAVGSDRGGQAGSLGWSCVVYSWGSGANYQLGTGSMDFHEAPVRVDSLHQLCVVQLTAAKYHSAAVTADGRLFTWGWGRGGRLGHPDFNIHSGETALIQPHRGGSGSGGGSNKDGKLGHAGMDTQPTPRKVADLRCRIAAVAASNRHSAAVSAAGEVLTWGCNRDGQLGYGTHNSANSPTPRLVDALKGRALTAVSLSKRHSVVLSAEGEVFTFGHRMVSPRKVQLAGARDTSRAPPLGGGAAAGVRFHKGHADMVRPVATAIAAGYSHTSVITRDGAVLVWASADPGPRVQEVLGALAGKRVVSLSTGKTRTAVVTSEGDIYVWQAAVPTAAAASAPAGSAGASSSGDHHTPSLYGTSADKPTSHPPPSFTGGASSAQQGGSRAGRDSSSSNPSTSAHPTVPSDPRLDRSCSGMEPVRGGAGSDTSRGSIDRRQQQQQQLAEPRIVVVPERVPGLKRASRVVVGEKHSLALQTWMAPQLEEHFGLVPGVDTSPAAAAGDQGFGQGHEQPPHSGRARPPSGPSSGSSSSCSPSSSKAGAVGSPSAELPSHDAPDRPLAGTGGGGAGGWRDDSGGGGAGRRGPLAGGGAVPSLQPTAVGSTPLTDIPRSHPSSRSTLSTALPRNLFTHPSNSPVAPLTMQYTTPSLPPRLSVRPCGRRPKAVKPSQTCIALWQGVFQAIVVHLAAAPVLEPDVLHPRPTVAPPEPRVDPSPAHPSDRSHSQLLCQRCVAASLAEPRNVLPLLEYADVAGVLELRGYCLALAAGNLDVIVTEARPALESLPIPLLTELEGLYKASMILGGPLANARTHPTASQRHTGAAGSSRGGNASLPPSTGSSPLTSHSLLHLPLAQLLHQASLPASTAAAAAAAGHGSSSTAAAAAPDAAASASASVEAQAGRRRALSSKLQTGCRPTGPPAWLSGQRLPAAASSDSYGGADGAGSGSASGFTAVQQAAARAAAIDSLRGQQEPGTSHTCLRSGVDLHGSTARGRVGVAEGRGAGPGRSAVGSFEAGDGGGVVERLRCSLARKLAAIDVLEKGEGEGRVLDGQQLAKMSQRGALQEAWKALESGAAPEQVAQLMSHAVEAAAKLAGVAGMAAAQARQQHQQHQQLQLIISSSGGSGSGAAATAGAPPSASRRKRTAVNEAAAAASSDPFSAVPPMSSSLPLSSPVCAPQQASASHHDAAAAVSEPGTAARPSMPDSFQVEVSETARDGAAAPPADLIASTSDRATYGMSPPDSSCATESIRLAGFVPLVQSDSSISSATGSGSGSGKAKSGKFSAAGKDNAVAERRGGLSLFLSGALDKPTAQHRPAPAMPNTSATTPSKPPAAGDAAAGPAASAAGKRVPAWGGATSAAAVPAAESSMRDILAAARAGGSHSGTAGLPEISSADASGTASNGAGSAVSSSAAAFPGSGFGGGGGGFGMGSFPGGPGSAAALPTPIAAAAGAAVCSIAAAGTDGRQAADVAFGGSGTTPSKPALGDFFPLRKATPAGGGATQGKRSGSSSSSSSIPTVGAATPAGGPMQAAASAAASPSPSGREGPSGVVWGSARGSSPPPPSQRSLKMIQEEQQALQPPPAPATPTPSPAPRQKPPLPGSTLPSTPSAAKAGSSAASSASAAGSAALKLGSIASSASGAGSTSAPSAPASGPAPAAGGVPGSGSSAAQPPAGAASPAWGGASAAASSRVAGLVTGGPGAGFSSSAMEWAALGTSPVASAANSWLLGSSPGMAARHNTTGSSPSQNKWYIPEPARPQPLGKIQMEEAEEAVMQQLRRRFGRPEAADPAAQGPGTSGAAGQRPKRRERQRRPDPDGDSPAPRTSVDSPGGGRERQPRGADGRAARDSLDRPAVRPASSASRAPRPAAGAGSGAAASLPAATGTVTRPASARTGASDAPAVSAAGGGGASAAAAAASGTAHGSESQAAGEAPETASSSSSSSRSRSAPRQAPRPTPSPQAHGRHATESGQPGRQRRGAVEAGEAPNTTSPHHHQPTPQHPHSRRQRPPDAQDGGGRGEGRPTAAPAGEGQAPSDSGHRGSDPLQAPREHRDPGRARERRQPPQQQQQQQQQQQTQGQGQDGVHPSHAHTGQHQQPRQRQQHQQPAHAGLLIGPAEPPATSRQQRQGGASEPRPRGQQEQQQQQPRVPQAAQTSDTATPGGQGLGHNQPLRSQRSGGRANPHPLQQPSTHNASSVLGEQQQQQQQPQQQLQQPQQQRRPRPQVSPQEHSTAFHTVMDDSALSHAGLKPSTGEQFEIINLAVAKIMLAVGDQAREDERVARWMLGMEALVLETVIEAVTTAEAVTAAALTVAA
ncbi:MAG: hypothetical protein WDW38_003944 [Sanguina aurantia]